MAKRKLEFIKVGNDKYLIKDSNNLVVSGKDILKMDEENCPKKKCKDCESKVDLKGTLKDETVKSKDNK
jgi:hypothetical protein